MGVYYQCGGGPQGQGAHYLSDPTGWFIQFDASMSEDPCTSELEVGKMQKPNWRRHLLGSREQHLHLASSWDREACLLGFETGQFAESPALDPWGLVRFWT